MEVNIDKIIELLELETAKRSKFVKFLDENRDPFIVLVGCILSLRTRDETTYPATLRLLNLGKTPEELLQAGVEKIANAIYPVGFSQNKARQIVGICHELVTKYSSKVPDNMDELLKFKGVGRKTANLVIGKGFGKPAICVDTHVHRICNRLGYVKTKTPDDTEMELRKILPPKYWLRINELMVTHGQNTCTPLKPKCPVCIIQDYCNKLI